MGRQQNKRWLIALLSAAAATLPLILIIWVLNGSELTEAPKALNPTNSAYADGIELVSTTSGTLVTIAIAILGAEGVWLFKEQPRTLAVQILAYAIYLMTILSIYLGIKLASWAGLAVASSEPDIRPLLAFLEWQALAVLCAGLLLSGLVMFSLIERGRS